MEGTLNQKRHSQSLRWHNPDQVLRVGAIALLSRITQHPVESVKRISAQVMRWQAAFATEQP
jgi:hypothetical protein